MKQQLMKMLKDKENEMIDIRRHLHRYPELSFQEEQTAQYIADFYKRKDVTIQTEVGNGHGIIVTIEGGKPGKTIGLTADFDALPITEETGLPFQSENQGVMHACARRLSDQLKRLHRWYRKNYSSACRRNSTRWCKKHFGIGSLR